MRTEWTDFLCDVADSLCGSYVQRGEVVRIGCRPFQECCRLYCMAGRSRHLDPALKNWDKAEARQQGGCPVHFKNVGESQEVTEKRGQKS